LRRPAIHVIAAVARNGVIGNAGGLPFRLSTDLKRFKALTTGRPVIMGRKTYESIGKPLPDRVNIVISRSANIVAENVVTVRSLNEALGIAAAVAQAGNVDSMCIIGGGEIYAQAISRADCLMITHVLADVDGDTHFPPIDHDRFEEVESTDVPAGERDNHATRYAVYHRRG
jgi:dihydrofolate reductase